MSVTDVLVNHVAPSVGVVIGNLMWLSPWPEISSALKAGRGIEDLNPLPWAATLSNCILWCYYSKITGGDIYIFSGNIFGIGLSLLYTLSASRLLGMTAIRRAHFEEPGSEAFHRVIREADASNYNFLITLIIPASAVVVTSVIFFFDLFMSSEHLQATRQEAVGALATACAMCYFILPSYTMLTVIRTQNAASISLPMVMCNTLNCLGWAVYGLAALDDGWVYGPNLAGLALAVLQLVMKMTIPSYAKGENNRDASENPSDSPSLSIA